MSELSYPTGHWARLGAITRLAIPVMGARVGLLTMATLDTAMLGHAGATELAYYAISAAAQLTLVTVGLGLLAGTQVLVAQARGSSELGRIGQIWRVASALAFLIGLIGSGVLWQGKAVLDWTGIAPDIAGGSEAPLRMVALGVPGGLLYMATALTLEGIGRPRAGLMVVLAGNIAKLILNWLLIFGPFGLPELGAAGANLATAIVRWLMFVSLVVYLRWLMPGAAAYGVAEPVREFGATLWRLVKLGAPIGLAQGLENSAFTTIAGFAALIGTTALATYQVALNLVALVFMVSSGLATATAVQVGIAAGRRDRQGMAASAWLGTGLEVALMLIAGLIIVFGRSVIAQLYTDDAALLAAAVPVLVIAAGVILPDGVQAVLMGALRGRGDVLVPTLLHLFSFWAVTVPLAWHLAFARAGSVEGLLAGLLVGLAVASLLLTLRLAAVGRHAPRRI